MKKERRHLGNGVYIEETVTGNFLLLKDHVWILLTAEVYRALKKYVENKESEYPSVTDLIRRLRRLTDCVRGMDYDTLDPDFEDAFNQAKALLADLGEEEGK